MPNMFGGDQMHPAYNPSVKLAPNEVLVGNTLYRINDGQRIDWETVDGKTGWSVPSQCPKEVLDKMATLSGPLVPEEVRTQANKVEEVLNQEPKEPLASNVLEAASEAEKLSQNARKRRRPGSPDQLKEYFDFKFGIEGETGSDFGVTVVERFPDGSKKPLGKFKSKQMAGIFIAALREEFNVPKTK